MRPTAAPDSIHFSFGASQRGGNDVLMAENLSLAFDGKPLFENVNLSISRQERVFLLGPNGCGNISPRVETCGLAPELTWGTTISCRPA